MNLQASDQREPSLLNATPNLSTCQRTKDALAGLNRIPYKRIIVYPFRLTELGSCEHFSLPGVAEPVKNIILLTIASERTYIEFYTGKLSWAANSMLDAVELSNRLSSAYDLDVALDINTGIFRITANLWIGDDWQTDHIRAALWEMLRFTTSRFKRIASEIMKLKPIDVPLTMVDKLDIRESRNVVKQFLMARQCSYLIEKDEYKSLLYCGRYADCDGIYHEYKCKITVTNSVILYEIENGELNRMLTMCRSQSELNQIVCKLALNLEMSSLILERPQAIAYGTNSDTVPYNDFKLKLKSKLIYSLLSKLDFETLLSAFIEGTIEEFRELISNISNCSKNSILEKHYEHIKMYSQILDFSEESSESDHQDNNLEASHFKVYSQSIMGRKELNLIDKLKQSKLLENFGLNYSSDEENSLSSLTFHAPPARPFNQMMEALEEKELILVLEDLEKLIEALKEVNLQFLDMCNVNFYWTSDHSCPSEIGLYVFCKDYLYEMLEVTDSPTETQDQIQQFLAKQNKISVSSTEGEEDLAHININTDNCSKEKTFVTSLDGIGKVSVYLKDIQGMTSSDLNQVCSSLYRAYQANRHPNLLICYGYKLIAHQKSVYFAYEHCTFSLSTFISQGMHLPNPIKFLTNVASVLGYLSSKPPQNINISPKRIMIDSKYQPKLMPFKSNTSKHIQNRPISDMDPNAWAIALQHSFGGIIMYVSSEGKFSPASPSLHQFISALTPTPGAENLIKSEANKLYSLIYEQSQTFYKIIDILQGIIPRDPYC